MKPKYLVALAVVLAVLILASQIDNGRDEDESLTEKAGLERLIDAKIKPGEVQVLELVRGSGEDPETLRIEKNETGDWILVSHWNLPARRQKVNDWLDAVLELHGEVISNNSEGHESTYRVAGDEGLMLKVFTDAPAPAATLWIGKSRGQGRTFVRREGEDTVYEGLAGLREAFRDGGYGEETPLSSKPWFEKEILRVERERIVKLALKHPDYSLELKKEEIKPDPDAEEAGEEAKPAPEEATWTIVAGDPGFPLQQGEIDTLLRNIAAVDVREAVDPAKKDEVGLGEPAYRVDATLDHGGVVTLFGSRRKAGQKVVCYLQEKGSPFIYTTSVFTFDSLFAEGKGLFDLPTPRVKAKEVRELELVQGKDKLRLKRLDAESEWERVVGPEGAVDQEKVKKLLERLGGWTAVEFAPPDRRQAAGLNAPTRALTATLADGATTTLQLGNPHPTILGVYVSGGDEAPVLVMKQDDVQVVFPRIVALVPPPPTKPETPDGEAGAEKDAETEAAPQ